MSKIYSLIRRADFIDLFKYGQFTLNPLNTVEFEECIENDEAKNALVRNLFEHSNSFDSSFAYLIIQYSPENYVKEYPVVNIEEVEHIYPLNMEAKKEFETSFDEHIRLDMPIFSNSFSEIQRWKTIGASERGALNVARLYGFTDSIEKCKTVISDDILREVVNEVYANRRPNGNFSIWVYLLMYERHSFYPRTMVGYFMDVVNVVCNFLGKEEVEESSVVRTDIYNVLNSMRGDMKIKDILTDLAQNERSQAFLKKLKDIEPNVDFIKVAAMYLFLKDRYHGGFRIEKNIINRVIEDSDYILSAYMLGLVYGQDKTYECFYESLPLPIYKSKKEMDIIHESQAYERIRAEEEMKHMEDERKWMGRQSRGVHSGKQSGYGKNSGKCETECGELANGPSFRGEQKPVSKELIPVITDNPATEDVLEVKTEGQQLELDFSRDQQVNLTFPCIMARLKKGTKNEYCKRPNPKEVNTVQEYQELYSEGWRKIDNNY